MQEQNTKAGSAPGTIQNYRKQNQADCGGNYLTAEKDNKQPSFDMLLSAAGYPSVYPEVLNELSR